MTATSAQPLELFGPQWRQTMSVQQARGLCRRLAVSHYENFSVLSALVPAHLRDDFAAVYAFCRWADDLGDEIGDRSRSLELLDWWRRELNQCFAGEPRHPVFLALRPTVVQHKLPIEPFDDLIGAFEQDQQVSRYQTWDALVGYCRRSANPVGRLVLMMCGEPRTGEIFARSDDICTALQLTNHWQDVRRDIIQRDRIYIPAELIAADDFEARLCASARQGYGVDQQFLSEYRSALKECVRRTWALFERGRSLLDSISPRTQPIVWLLAAGGQHVLRQIEMWNYETALHRPALGRVPRFMLVAKAWLRARSARAATKSSSTAEEAS